jgi:hypothetical protein
MEDKMCDCGRQEGQLCVCKDEGSIKNLDALWDEILPEKIQYKYAEDDIIADFQKYIDRTYGEHYKTEDQNIECFDVWLALGDATPTFRNTAIKYLWRVGKKGDHESAKDDLMKALHYTLMCLYTNHYRPK